MRDRVEDVPYEFRRAWFEADLSSQIESHVAEEVSREGTKSRSSSDGFDSQGSNHNHQRRYTDRKSKSSNSSWYNGPYLYWGNNPYIKAAVTVAELVVILSVCKVH